MVNSLLALDIDNDGDTDYVSGNFGENTYLKANMEMPISILAKDFDSNGSIVLLFLISFEIVLG